MEELAHLAPEDVFRLAIARSQYPLSVLAKRLNVSPAFLRRVTSTEKYFPSFVDIPGFCVAAGNTLVIEWLLARVTAGNTVLPTITPTFLHNQVLCLTSDLGHVADRIIRATADNRITKAENRGILKEVLDLVEAATALAAALRDHDKKVGRHA